MLLLRIAFLLIALTAAYITTRAGAGVTRLMPVGGSDMMPRLDLVSSDGLPTPAPLSPCVEQWSSKEFYFNNSITSNFASSHEKLIRMFDNADRFLLGFDPYGGFIMTVNVWLLLALSIAVLIALLLSLLRARGSYTLSVVRLCSLMGVRWWGMKRLQKTIFAPCRAKKASARSRSAGSMRTMRPKRFSSGRPP